MNGDTKTDVKGRQTAGRQVGRAAPPLPVRDGVGPSCVALPEGPWATIAECLVERFAAVGAAAWRARIEAGEVVDDLGVPVTMTRVHRARTRIHYYRSVADEPTVPFEEAVLYRDAHIVIADKPHFMAVTPSGRHLRETLLARLKRRLGIDTLVPVHRIDRETAGLVMFSIEPSTRGRYQRLFAERTVEKTYECIAPRRGDLVWPVTRQSRLIDDPAHFMRMCEVAGPPNAETTIESIERSGPWARYRLRPTTGRRHQLRVQCAALGLPIAGDRIYPELLAADSDDPALPLQLLARSLAFTDPVDGTARRFETSRSLLALDAPPLRALAR